LSVEAVRLRCKGGVIASPTVRRLRVLAACLVIVLGNAASAGARSIAQAEQNLLDAINQARAQYHLRPLVRTPRLDAAARGHSDDMIREGAFVHTRRLGRLPGRVIGENLAFCTNSIRARAIVRAWLASPEHRANLLRPGFRRIGIGVAVGRFDGVRNGRVVTVDFSGR
jgi:uncharacterized protein YkwD